MKSFILLFTLIFNFSIYSQWQADVRLTYNGAQSYLPGYNCSRVISSNGNLLHLVWFDERDGNWEVYYKRSSDSGVNWGSDTRLTNNSAESWNPNIAVSGQSVNLIWSDDRDGNGEIYYKRSTDGGVNWGTDTRLTNNSAYSTNGSIAVTGSILHVTWCDNRDGKMEVYYKRSTDMGINWGTDTRLTFNNTTVHSFGIAIAASGSILHIVWYDDHDGNFEIYYKRSADNGLSWGSDTRLTNSPNVSDLATLAVSDSVIHVVWQDARDGNRQLYYKRSSNSGISWGPDIHLINNATESTSPSIFSSGSNIHITWQDPRHGGWEIYYKRSLDGGLSWGPETRLTNNSAWSVRSFCAISGSMVHVVWIDERDGNWEVYYKKDPTGNPVTQPPPAPNLVSPLNNSFNQLSTVRFIWNKSFGTLTYRLQVAQDSLFTNLVVNDSTLTDSTIVVTNLTLNRYYWWRVNAKNSIGSSPYSAVWKFGTFLVGLNQISAEIPKEFKLFNNYPNPFNPVTKIKFDIPFSRRVDAEGGRGVLTSLTIYDILGRKVAALVNEQLQPGTYEVDWNASHRASGIYYYKLEAKSFSEIKKMVLLK